MGGGGIFSLNYRYTPLAIFLNNFLHVATITNLNFTHWIKNWTAVQTPWSKDILYILYICTGSSQLFAMTQDWGCSIKYSHKTQPPQAQVRTTYISTTVLSYLHNHMPHVFVNSILAWKSTITCKILRDRPTSTSSYYHGSANSRYVNGSLETSLTLKVNSFNV